MLRWSVLTWSASTDLLAAASSILYFLNRGSTHLHSHQSSDQDGPIKLASDSFGDRRIAGLQGQRSDVAEADGGQRRQAEVAENREKVLILGRLARARGHDADKGFRLSSLQSVCAPRTQL